MDMMLRSGTHRVPNDRWDSCLGFRDGNTLNH